MSSVFLATSRNLFDGFYTYGYENDLDEPGKMTWTDDFYGSQIRKIIFMSYDVIAL